ncbi:MAG: discoidin domain-containing protein [Sedimentisphaerales bacterium]|nr:discoidin domain-containing protein [Sedimentisphaerales bacterium]
MKRIIAFTTIAAVFLLPQAIGYGGFRLVENFDAMATGSPDGLACTGVLGGTWDTESEATGNVVIEDNTGSRVVRFMTTSAGAARGVGFNGISNPIEDGETGKVFFRFMIRTDSQVPRTYIGLITDTSSNPITAGLIGNVANLAVGFGLLDNGTGGFDMVKVDGSTILKSGLSRATWYNVWLIVDNTTDRFDIYLSTATGPSGEPTMPEPGDLVAGGIPFTSPVTDAFVGMAFVCPGGTIQSSRTYVDEIYWDGDEGLAPSQAAKRPDPSSNATDIRYDTVLSWVAGPDAVAHDVYLGTNLQDVQAASRTDPRGVLVSQGQTATSFNPGPLAFGQTYYWRVDEIAAPPTSTIYTGSIWSFTVEPYVYPIRPTTATASSSMSPDSDPIKTIDNSGLNQADQHSTSNTDMWLSNPSEPLPAWIQYEFDNTYMFQDLLVWNSNMAIEPTIGLGAKDIEILYSQDGINWSTLGHFQLNQATGSPNYTPNTQINLQGLVAKYIKLTINSNYSGLINQTGLSEVRFFQVPTRAFYPSPANAATNVPLDATVDFRPGRLAQTHTIYLAPDQNAVSNALATSISIQKHSFNLSQFNPTYATTYYWRVDEVNQLADPPTWQGNIWSFSTVPYAVVDDFEDYDDICKRIFFYWTDGLGHSGSADCSVPPATGNGTGSTVGNIQPPFAERTIVNSGRQSMPFAYDNSSSPFYSETTKLLTPAQDWTKGGVDTLTIYLRGMAPPFLEYAPGAMLLNGTGSDIYGTADQGRFIYKELHGDGSIIARVESLANTHAWAKVGVMIRESLNPDASWAYVLYAGQNGVRFQARLQTAASATSDTPIATPDQIAMRVPVWIKLERKSNLFYGYYSTDGTNWTAMAWNPQTIQMPLDVYIGIAITSHVANVVCGAKLTSISTTGNITGSWQSADLGVAQPLEAGNSPQQVYLVLKDLSGNTKLVAHPDPTVIATGAWERWDIPLTTFNNLNLKAISALTLGVGNRSNPTPNGKGTIYIDDIRLTRTANP